jgi:hypothetical protein
MANTKKTLFFHNNPAIGGQRIGAVAKAIAVTI